MGKENQSFKMAIQSYLDQRAKEDNLFAASYAKLDKNLSECCDYIISEAKKRGGSAVAIPDDEVFGLAVHYYDEDNIKVKKQSNCKVATSNSEKLKKGKQSSGQPLPKEEFPTYTKSKRMEKKKESSSVQFLLFEEP